MILPPFPHPAAMAASLSILLLITPGSGSAIGDDPWADAVVSYEPGSNAAVGYTDSLTALGSPERFTGEGIFPGAVTVFNSAFGTDELVSIGEGGSLIVRFDTPVTDDPDNLYGIDLLIFGNAGFIDVNYPNGQIGMPAALFTDAGGLIEVSVDGSEGSWIAVPGVTPDDLFPTQGYSDLLDPYSSVAGLVPTDFTRPVDPYLQLDDFDGKTFADVLGFYHDSGGGLGIDIGPLGLSEISYVRMSNPIGSGVTPEIDALADAAPRRPGDVDLNGTVDVSDLLLLLVGWGVLAPGDPPADFDNNRLVDVNDLITLLAEWD